MVSGHYSQTLLDNISEGIAFYDSNLLAQNVIDEYWSNLQMRDMWVIYEPRLVRQENGYSDIRRSEYNYDILYRRPLNTLLEVSTQIEEPIASVSAEPIPIISDSKDKDRPDNAHSDNESNISIVADATLDLNIGGVSND
jgi:hypothetical protein